MQNVFNISSSESSEVDPFMSKKKKKKKACNRGQLMRDAAAISQLQSRMSLSPPLGASLHPYLSQVAGRISGICAKVVEPPCG
jgi:hypothetical protein